LTTDSFLAVCKAQGACPEGYQRVPDDGEQSA
jgi:hypothetical protein